MCGLSPTRWPRTTISRYRFVWSYGPVSRAVGKGTMYVAGRGAAGPPSTLPVHGLPASTPLISAYCRIAQRAG